MHKRFTLLVLLIIVLLIGFGSAVMAEGLSDLQNKRDELENQITETSKELEEIQIEITANLEQLNNLNARIAEYENDICTYEQSLVEIQGEILTVSKKLNLVEQNYNLQKELLQNRIVALYEAGDIMYLDVLLNSTTVSEFISNYYVIGEIIELDNELLESI